MATRQRNSEQSTVESSTVEDAELVHSETYTDAELAALTSFEEAAELAAKVHGVVTADTVIGDGFSLIKGDDAKRRYVGRPVMLMSWKFVPGDFGDEFVVAHCVAPTDNGGMAKFIITDGSTGIAKELRQLTDQTGRTGGLLVHSGFRESAYPFCTECNKAVNNDHSAETGHKTAPKSTFYLDPTRKQLAG